MACGLHVEPAAKAVAVGSTGRVAFVGLSGSATVDGRRESPPVLSEFNVGNRTERYRKSVLTILTGLRTRGPAFPGVQSEMQPLSKKLSFALSMMLVGCLLTGVAMSLPQVLRHDAFADQTGPAKIANHDLAAAQDMSTAFRNVAEAIRPSVVSINTRVKAKPVQRKGNRRSLPPGFPPIFQDDFFQQFDFQDQVPHDESGMGSGVIVRENGYILTNNHVVSGADELTVELSDGRKVTGEVVGTDPATDLAVVKIDAQGLQAASLGSSDEIRVGDWVLAIGSPFGLEQTVTAGIISGKNRVQGIVGDGDGFEDFLQTDAAINPGNSGGPLVNLKGELVGINTAILSRSGGNAGIGFAIPVSLARPVLESIIKNGEVRRGFLGAQLEEINPDVVQKYGLSVNRGALINGVLEGQPAANAGIQPGDVVTKLDGRKIDDRTQLRNYIASRSPGDTVAMEIVRGDKTIQLQVKLLERTEEAMAMFGGDPLPGATLEPVTPQSARQFGYDNLTDGLIVTGVQENSPAAQVGLQVGDVIETAGGQPVSTVNDLLQSIRESQKRQRPVRIIVLRGDVRMLLVI